MPFYTLLGLCTKRINSNKLNDIEIWFDDMQGFWRFSADLVKY
jgi:hypothetical protein